MRVLLSAVVIVGLSSAASAAVADKATTSELPAALQALNPSMSKILTHAAADAIRGEGGYYPSYNVDTHKHKHGKGHHKGKTNHGHTKGHDGHGNHHGHHGNHHGHKHHGHKR